MPSPRADSTVVAAASVETIRREAMQRLRELQPALDEAEKLRDVIAVIDRDAVGAAAPRPTLVPDSAAPGGERRAPAANGANKRLILETVARNPGITPREIASHTGIKRTVVASTVNRLKRHGELREDAAPGRRGGVSLARTAA